MTNSLAKFSSQTIKQESHCPCSSQKNFIDCCGRFLPITNKPAIETNPTLPATAEQLMRSRYTAFVLNIPEYIIQTTLPSQQQFLDADDLSQWATETDWAGLEVIQHTAILGKNHAQVEFKAFFNTSIGKDFHHELSTFIKIKQSSVKHSSLKHSSVKQNNSDQFKWYFIDPNALEQQQPIGKMACICGGKDKYKHCCGQFVG